MSEEGKKLFNSLSEKEQRTIVGKLKKFIQNIVDWVNGLLGTYESKSYEAAALRDFKEELSEISKLWDQMLVKSIEANKALTAEGTTGEAFANEAATDAQMSERDTITQADIDAIRSIGRKSVNKFTSEDIKKAEPFARRMFKELGVKSPFFRAWFGDWRANDIKNPAFATDIPQNRSYSTKNRYIENEDTKISIQITKDLFEDSLHYAYKDKQYIERLLSNIDTVLERAILFDTAVSDANKSNKKGSSQFMHYLYSVVEYQGAPFLAKITVEEYDTDGKHRAYNAQRIKMSALSRAQYSQLKAAYRGNNASNADAISISDLFQLVKTYDKEFTPIEPSKVVNGVGTPKVVYHSTNEKFTIFDITKSRSWDGTPDYDLPGFYFSENYDDSAAYGGNVGEYYIKITNPYEGDIYSLKKKLGSFRKAYEYLIEQKYDGVIVDELGEGSYEYIVLKPENIKSATDNIGTFDKGNEDIQFSERDYSYESLIKKLDMKLTVVGDDVPSNRADIVHQAIKNANSVGYTNENGNAVIRVDDIQTDVIVPKKSIVHGLDRRMSTQAPVMVKIGEVLKNSIRVNELTPRSENAKNTYVLIGSAVNKSNELYIASFVVNRFTNEVAEIDVLYSANAKKESAALLPKITDESATPTDSVISIAELLKYVNRYFPDILPESVLRHYGHTERPDGTLGESVLFSEKDYGTSAYDLIGNVYTEKEYKDFGWARANNLLNAGQNADYRSKFADAKVGRAKFNKSKKGEYIIPVSDIYDPDFEGVNNVLVFAKGTIDKPIITSIIEIYEFNETELDRIRRQIYDGERRGIQQKAGKLFGRYFSSDFKFQSNQQRIGSKSVGNSGDNGYRGRSGEEAYGAEEKNEIKYSERDEGISAYDLIGEKKALEKRYDRLKIDFENLKERLKLEKTLTKGKIIQQSQLEAVARYLIKYGDSNYSSVELAKLLNNLYVDIQDGATDGTMAFDEMYAKCYEVAEKIRTGAKVKVERPALYEKILKEIRSARIAPNEGQKGDAKHRFGDHYIGKFRGRVIIANDGVPLDTKWSEWAALYPSVFDKNISPSQQLVELYDKHPMDLICTSKSV